MIWCYCGVGWDVGREPKGWRRDFAWSEWWRHHGGPGRKCLWNERAGYGGKGG